MSSWDIVLSQRGMSLVTIWKKNYEQVPHKKALGKTECQVPIVTIKKLNSIKTY